MIETGHIIEKTLNTTKVCYQFDVDINDSDVLSIHSYNTFVSIEDSNSQIINIGISQYAKIRLKVTIDVDNAPDNGL